jgi:hypothetical protein
MAKTLSPGEQTLKLLNGAVSMSKCSFAAAAKGIGVEPNDIYRWRNATRVPDRFIDRVTKWAHKVAHYHVPVDKLKVTSEPWTKPEPWDGTWLHTTPGKIKAFLDRHEMRRGDFAVKIHVSPGTVTNWLDHEVIAIPKNQRMAESFMSKYDEEKRFIDGSFDGQRRRTPINPEALKKRRKPKRDRLAAVLMEFSKEDGDSLADSILYTADILRSLQTLGKLPE